MPPTFSVRTSDDVLRRIDLYCAAAEINRTEFFRRGAIRELVFPTQRVFFDLATRVRVLFGSGARLTLETVGTNEGPPTFGVKPAKLVIDVEVDGQIQRWNLVEHPTNQEWTSAERPDVSKMLEPFQLIARTFVERSPGEAGLARHVATVEAVCSDLEPPAHGGRHVARLGTLDLPTGAGDLFQVSVDSLRDYAVLTDPAGRPVEL